MNMCPWLRVAKKGPKKEIAENEESFLRNGGLVLEKLINSCDGKSNPIPAFSAIDLLKVTNNYAPDQFLHRDSFYTLYKGIHESRMIMVKKFEYKDRNLKFDDCLEGSIKEVVMASQMNHGNVLNLLGCCLETQFPIHVYEFASNGNLSDYIYDVEEGENPSENGLRLSWESRLRIATEIADALSYLHMAFSQIIIHRDLKPRNIFLDENWVAKLSDFSLSVSIPLGETHVEAGIAGTKGYIAPECLLADGVTEKADVYSFGVLLLELLTGSRNLIVDHDIPFIVDRAIGFIENGCVGKFVKPIILEGGVDQQQLQASMELALRCANEENEDERPTMMDVAQELRRIRRTRSSPLGT